MSQIFLWYHEIPELSHEVFSPDNPLTYFEICQMPDRPHKVFERFKKAVEEDVCGRADLVREEIQIVLDREEIVDYFQDLLRSGKISFLVTHNDTKINNVLIPHS